MSAPTSETESIRKASGTLAFFILFSRILGLVRNQILGHFFGAGLVADAFIAAFTIPNALRRLFGEGALTPAIVTLLTRSHKRDPDWRSFLSNAFYWLSLILILLTLLGVFFSQELVGLYVPEFKDHPEKFALTVKLTQFLFPFILLMAWAAFFMGVLNTFRSFGSAASGPALLNIAVIVIVPVVFYLLKPLPQVGIYYYGGAILIGGLLSVLVQLPELKKAEALPMLAFDPKDRRVYELGRMLLPSVFSMGVYQLNIVVNRMFASDIPGAVSHLYFADLLLELPVSMIAVSLGMAVQPSFSRLIAEENWKELARTFQLSFGAVLFLAVPAAVGLIVLREPLIASIFLTGRFSIHDVDVSAAALATYSIGLPFFAGLRIILPMFFANRDTRTPAMIGFVALAVNFLAAWQFSKSFGTPGIALATSVSSIANVTILMALLARRYPQFGWGHIAFEFLKMLVAGAVMGGALYLLNSFLIPADFWLSRGLSVSKALLLLLLVGVGVAIYFGLAKALKIAFADSVINRFRGRLSRRPRSS